LALAPLLVHPPLLRAAAAAFRFERHCCLPRVPLPHLAETFPLRLLHSPCPTPTLVF
jgi:hypothetical protein